MLRETYYFKNNIQCPRIENIYISYERNSIIFDFSIYLIWTMNQNCLYSILDSQISAMCREQILQILMIQMQKNLLTEYYSKLIVEKTFHVHNILCI